MKTLCKGCDECLDENNIIDHIDGELNNIKLNNLREVNQRINHHNKKVKRKNYFHGVNENHNGKFSSSITINGNIKNLGTFSSQEEAYHSYVLESKKNNLKIDVFQEYHKDYLTWLDSPNYKFIREESPAKQKNELLRGVYYKKSTDRYESKYKRKYIGTHYTLKDAHINYQNYYYKDNKVFNVFCDGYDLVKSDLIFDGVISAWIHRLGDIYRTGINKRDKNGNKKLVLMNLVTKISPKIINVGGVKYQDLVHPFWSNEKIQEYINQFHNPDVGSHTYTYGQLIYNYNGVNQYKEVIEKLKNDSGTRRGIISLWNPEVDSFRESNPCLNHIELYVENNKLCSTITFRSHSYDNAMPLNLYAIFDMLIKMSNELGLDVGIMTLISINAHIYKESMDMVEKVFFDKDLIGKII